MNDFNSMFREHLKSVVSANGFDLRKNKKTISDDDIQELFGKLESDGIIVSAIISGEKKYRLTEAGKAIMEAFVFGLPDSKEE